MGMKMNGRKIRPIANPVPWRKLLARSSITMMWITTLMKGMKYRISHQPGRPTTFSNTYRL
jgi:hypothetical protein